MGLSELTLSKVGSNIGAAKLVQHRDPEIFVKFAQTQEGPSMFDQAWQMAGDNKYLLGGLGLGAAAGTAVGGWGGLGLGLLGAAGGYLLNQAGASDQNMGFMDRINVLTDGWQAHKNLGGMSQGAQSAIKDKYGGGANAGILSQANKWSQAPQEMRNIAANPAAMKNLNTALGSENQSGKLGQLASAHDIYSTWKDTEAGQTFNQYMTPGSENFDSQYGSGLREDLAKRGINFKDLGGLAGQSAEQMLANPDSVNAMQGYLNMSDEDRGHLGSLMSTKSKSGFDDALFRVGTGKEPTIGNKVQVGVGQAVDGAKSWLHDKVDEAPDWMSNMIPGFGSAKKVVGGVMK